MTSQLTDAIVVAMSEPNSKPSKTAFTPALCGKRDGKPVAGKPWGVGVVTEGVSG